MFTGSNEAFYGTGLYINTQITSSLFSIGALMVNMLWTALRNAGKDVVFFPISMTVSVPAVPVLLAVKRRCAVLLANRRDGGHSVGFL